jgi:hypothetical protein
VRCRRKSVNKDLKRKNRFKVIRTIFQIAFCLAAVIIITGVALYPKHYKEPDRTKWGQGNGFIALSYEGVSLKNSDKLVSKDQLDSQLKALHDLGYVTVDTKDIINYYKGGGPLPQKALYLMFEDGRKDSFIFAEPILEKYNFKAVMFTYASNIEDSNRLFLKKNDIKYLEKSTYWEVGSNGYRYSYINVYKKDSKGSDDNNKDIKYTHYLMDYLRDDDGIPLESKEQMKQRITWDYDEMNRIYKDDLGYQPEVYMIMHANTLFSNMNPAVEEINLSNIYKHFILMFNRQGLCFNSKGDSVYNLTRVQVQPDWTVERLLTEIELNVHKR